MAPRLDFRTSRKQRLQPRRSPSSKSEARGGLQLFERRDIRGCERLNKGTCDHFSASFSCGEHPEVEYREVPRSETPPSASFFFAAARDGQFRRQGTGLS